MRRIKKLAAVLLAIAVMLPAVVAAALPAAVTRDDVAEAYRAAVEWAAAHVDDEIRYEFIDSVSLADDEIADIVELIYRFYNLLLELEGSHDLGLEELALLVLALSLNDELDVLEFWLLELEIIAAFAVYLDAEIAAQILDLPVFEQLDAFIMPRGVFSVLIVYANEHFADIFAHYGAEIVDILNFDLFEAHERYLATGEMPHGLAVLNGLMGIDISAQLLAINETDEENTEADLLLEQIYQIFDGFVWGDLPAETFVDIRLGMGNLEQRLAFETNYAMFFDIMLDFNVFARLNLFFRNNSDEYAFFYILAFGIQAQPFVFVVPPGGERAIQLMPMDIIAVIVEVTIMSMQGEAVDGEFAIRLTEYPLLQ